MGCCFCTLLREHHIYRPFLTESMPQPAVLTLLSGAFSGGATAISEFIFFRFISGAGAFSQLAAVPIWVNEVVPPKNRGGFITLMGVMLLVGYNTAIWGSYGFFFYHPEANNQWRAMLALQCLPATILLFSLPWIPESPRWLVMKDRIEDAELVLRKLHEPREAEIELQQIQAQIKIDRTLPNDWLTMLWKKPSYRKRSLLSFGTTASIQFSGVLVINSTLSWTVRRFLCDANAFVIQSTARPSIRASAMTTQLSSLWLVPGLPQLSSRPSCQ